jgi:hypothetical protein
MINPFTEFGRTVFTGFVIISAVFLLVKIFVFKYPAAKAAYLPLILSASGAAVCFISYFIKPLALPFYYVWFAAGASVRIVMTNVLLSLFFYFIFTPVGLALRYLTRRDPLNLEQAKARRSN